LALSQRENRRVTGLKKLGGGRAIVHAELH
jgi:hypothetical protein